VIIYKTAEKESRTSDTRSMQIMQYE